MQDADSQPSTKQQLANDRNLPLVAGHEHQLFCWIFHIPPGSNWHEPELHLAKLLSTNRPVATGSFWPVIASSILNLPMSALHLQAVIAMFVFSRSLCDPLQ